ncbi:hypothetical protein HOA92_07330 [archaeon]|nr:hypothetical protein [archaeon]MBT6762825.1 hypothetical protein [archaeon]
MPIPKNKNYIFIAVNIGSTSKKYSVYSNQEEITSINVSELQKTKNHQSFSINEFLKQTMSVNGFNINKNIKLIFGIRIVAPGTFFTKHQIINQRFLDKLKKAEPLDPIHISSTIKEINEIRKHFPNSKIIAVSDSKIHTNRPEYAKNYPLNKKLIKKFDLYKFGYHGLAAGSAISQLKSKKILKAKTIICHLGGGTSVTAIKNGKSIETTMGFSPLEGIMGVTRSGSLDPTILDILYKNKKIDLSKLYQYSGFLGLTGSSDLLKITEKSKNRSNENEKLAIDLYCYQVQKAVGSAISQIKGVDLIVFTGGIGTGSSLIRKKICAQFDYLNLKLDHKKNKYHLPGIISDRYSKVKVALVHIDEMQEILKVCQNFI